MEKISTEPYKGTRDFYPEDMFLENYIFNVMRRVSERYGYEEYGASILEDAALYEAKTGEEIVNEQTYAFTDRGKRRVIIRPEMTPTIARMVARKRNELSFPLRWYSIPNLFRYERPQRGRLREHFQLNVDMFGVEGIEAEVEIISIAKGIMNEFGAGDSDFEIRINSRKILDSFFKDVLGLKAKDATHLAKLLDKMEKMKDSEVKAGIKEIVPGKEREVSKFIAAKKIEDLPGKIEDTDGALELEELLQILKKKGFKNILFTPSLVRGFDYYNSIVFEVFDKDPKNSRSLFGGGRYDNLLDIFGKEKVPAVGFGMGDVTIRDFLETRGLLPEYTSSTDVYICTIGEGVSEERDKVVGYLRENGINVSVDLTGKKVNTQIKTADRKKIPFIICIGEDEKKSEILKLKDMRKRKEYELPLEKIPEKIKKELKKI